jgi:DNA polymerase I-like protein with 3'-5' exonuclease and polymerase domains
MPLFSLPPRADRSDDTAIIKKAKKSKKSPATVRGGGGIASQIANIKAKVLKELGQFEDETLIIRDELTLSTYITKAIAYGEIGVDTETNGLDPLTDECVGVCLYVPDEKTTYIPINHVSYITMERVDNQLPTEVVAKYLKLLEDNKVRVIMFNAVFDIRVLKDQVGVKLSCYWDCKIASKMMNENEDYGEGGLKQLHNKYVLGGAGDPFDFDSLFKGIKAGLVPINVFALYSAHDPKITWQLYDFQRKYIYYEPDKPNMDRNGMNGVSWVFFNIEMPIVEVVVAMEDTGITLDTEYAKELEARYIQLKEDAKNKVYELLEPYEQDINKAILSGVKLDNPINIGSPQQLSILFYDILKYQSVDKKSPRGTGKAILKKWDTDLAKAVLEYKAVDKLLGTFIVKLPKELNPNDGRVHGRFNQYGAKTGRFSSKNPNLQQIPSHNKDIRPMFIATDGYVLMSSDFSQQEPKCLAALCRKAGDSQMYDTFMAGKDLYSEIASKSFHKTYEECREFDDNGNKNPPEYKERRAKAKKILLASLYGMGVPTIAEDLQTTEAEAQSIKDSVFLGFPAIGEFEDSSLKMAKELGYVTTVCGRKRRLPDLQLPEYEFRWESGYEPVGDILDFDELEIEVPYSKQKFYITKLNNARNKKQKFAVIDSAKKDHIQIISNRGLIAEATRQCVNSRIQGSAADLTKLAMIELFSNERLKELGFRILIPVHDEIIAECPEHNAKECAELLSQTMSKAAEQILEMPIKCDVEVTKAWYGKEVEFAYEEEEDDE